MRKLLPILAIASIVGCAAPPPVRIASSVLTRTVLKKAKEEYQQAHPQTSLSPVPVPVSTPQG
jgi:NifU-like protein involved in Fe-S cluster formation